MKREDKNKLYKKLKNEFSLTQKEVHLFGELLFERIGRRYEALIPDYDQCWSLDEEINLFSKICTIVVRMQGEKILREYEKENNKSLDKEKRKKN